MEAILIAIITTLGGSGGVAVIWQAILDSKEKRKAKEEDLGERFSKRLEDRLNASEKRNEELEDELEAEKEYTTLLIVYLAHNGLRIPKRGEYYHVD